jgi:glyoxylase-like metal-dependent hydrolase (beta-lactamase superfamily II)
MRRRLLLSLVPAALVTALVAGVAGGDVAAQNAPATASTAGQRVATMKVQGNVHIVHGAGANITVQAGELGAIVVDSGLAQDADAVLATIRTLTLKPIRFVINTHGHADHVGGNEQLAAAGISVAPGRGVATVGAGQGTRAEIVAHELVLNRMSLPGTPVAMRMPVAAWPTATYSARRKEFFYNGEAVQIFHQPSAHTDGDSIVYFRRSDVVAAGDVYVTTSYPVIDAPRGGSIQGVLDGLNVLLELVVGGEKTEGGTMIVPGHGRISDEADLVEYRDMVTIIRDRIQDMKKKGLTLEQVRAARPTLDYDGLYGAATGWSPAQFVDAVYKDLR